MMEAIRKEVQKLCTGDGRVRIQEAEKNNCVVKHGLVIGEDRKRISPFVYLEPYLSMLENGKTTIEETAKTIYGVYRNHCGKNSGIVNELFQFVGNG